MTESRTEIHMVHSCETTRRVWTDEFGYEWEFPPQPERPIPERDHEAEIASTVGGGVNRDR